MNDPLHKYFIISLILTRQQMSHYFFKAAAGNILFPNMLTTGKRFYLNVVRLAIGCFPPARFSSIICSILHHKIAVFLPAGSCKLMFKFLKTGFPRPKATPVSARLFALPALSFYSSSNYLKCRPEGRPILLQFSPAGDKHRAGWGIKT